MAPIDQRGMLDDQPFSYRASKDGKVFLAWRGKQVMILKGKQAHDFLARVLDLDEPAAQLLMARLTGNFKRGNERKPTSR